jgi:parallel beta-helix repeat protein
MSSFRKSLASLIFALFLISLITVSLPPAKSQPIKNIVINGDGSVTGTNAITQKGNTYTLTENFTSSLVVDKDDIVLNGAGFTIQGSVDIKNHTLNDQNPDKEPLNETAIFLTGRTNVTIKNMGIACFGVGIALVNSLNCTISGNKLYSNYGYPGAIFLNNSLNNWITQNFLNTTAQIGVGLWSFSSNNIISENKISDSGSAGILIGGSNNTILGNNIEKGSDAIDISFSSNAVIGNNISSGEGISLFSASNNLVSKNLINASDYGIYGGTENYNNTFFLNTIGNCKATLGFNDDGFNDDTNSTFYDNNFVNCSLNVSYLNEFYKGPHYYSSPQIIETHNWDNGTQGNYWSDYQTKYPNAKEVNNTGTYDTPYTVTPAGYPYLFYDYHPLVNQVEFSQNITALPSWANPEPLNQPIPSPNVEKAIVVGALAVLLFAVLSLLLLRRHRKTNKLNQ